MRQKVDVFKKNKKLIISICIVFLAVILVYRVAAPTDDISSSEKIAKKYIESMLSGDASKAVSYMSKYSVSESSYDTKKLLINALDKKLESAIEKYKEEYGNLWDYEVEIIDSVEYSADEYSELCEYYDFDGMIIVYLEVKHTGGLLFTQKEGSEDFEVLLAKEDGKWVVVAW